MNPQAYGKVVQLYKRDHTFVDRHRQSGVPDEASRRKRRRKLKRIQEAEHEKKELEEEEEKGTEESSGSGASSPTSKGSETPSLASSASSVDAPVVNYLGIDKPFIRASSLDTLLEKTECERLPVTSKSTSNMDAVAGSVDTPLTGIPGTSTVVKAGTGGWMSKMMRRLMFWRSTESILETVETSAENTTSEVVPSVEEVGASQTVELPVGNTSLNLNPSVEEVVASQTVELPVGNTSSNLNPSVENVETLETVETSVGNVTSKVAPSAGDTQASANVHIETNIQRFPGVSLLTEESNLRGRTNVSSAEKGSETIATQVVGNDGSVLGSFVVHKDDASLVSAGDKEPNDPVRDGTISRVEYNCVKVTREMPEGETVVNENSSQTHENLPSCGLSDTNLPNSDADRNTHVDVKMETILQNTFPKGHLVLPKTSNGQQLSSSVDSASNEQIRKGKHVDEDVPHTDEQMRATNVLTGFEVTADTKRDVNENDPSVSDRRVVASPTIVEVAVSTVGDGSVTIVKEISDSERISEENLADTSCYGLVSPFAITRDNRNSQNNLSVENVFPQSAEEYVFPISSSEENTPFAGGIPGEMIVLPRNAIGEKEIVNDSLCEGSIPTVTDSEQCPSAVDTETKQIQIVETPFQFPNCNEDKVLRCSLDDVVQIVRPSPTDHNSSEHQVPPRDSAQIETQVSKASGGSLLLLFS